MRQRILIGLIWFVGVLHSPENALASTPTPVPNLYGTPSVACNGQTAVLDFQLYTDSVMNYEFTVHLAAINCEPDGNAVFDFSYSQLMTEPVASPVPSAEQESAPETLDTLPITENFTLTCGDKTATLFIKLNAPSDMDLEATVSIKASDCQTTKGYTYVHRTVDLMATLTPTS